jgi:Tfp pilus assembly protein PilF
LLAAGRYKEAEQLLASQPQSAAVFALGSVIATVQDHRDAGLSFAQRALTKDPTSTAAKLALSYAHQSRFELEEAFAVARDAAAAEPGNGLAVSRRAELELALGLVSEAQTSAQEAERLQPRLGRARAILGFTQLAAMDASAAHEAFRRALTLQSEDPLSWMGLGLAKIRLGRLAEGRADIETAVGHAPNNALIRSYLGKAYFEEKRAPLDAQALNTAKRLDPHDPTPWFYDAIRRYYANEPVQAMQNLRDSIEKNDNRGVYRSRLLLDQDLAARGASLGRIYGSLGFDQLAFEQGRESLALDPASSSAHRLLADAFVRRPRHEITRLSELLQAQLLQPLTVTPLQPQWVESGVQMLPSGGPTGLGSNEFNPLFVRDGTTFSVTGQAGNRDTRGGAVTASAISGRLAGSVSQFRFQTEGFRPNNDASHDLTNAFVQFAATPQIDVQAELRRRRTDQGDLNLRFDPDRYDPIKRRAIDQDTARVGGHLSLGPGSDLLVSALHIDRQERIVESIPSIPNGSAKVKGDRHGYLLEGQYLMRKERFNLVLGSGYSEVDIKDRTALNFGLPSELIPPIDTLDQYTQQHGNAYLYSNIELSPSILATVGASYDAFEDHQSQTSRANPKLGLQWTLSGNLRLRMAYFKTLKRALVTDQTIEPTQLAGFTQFFDDVDGTESRSYGIGLDMQWHDRLYAGLEWQHRDLDRPTPETKDTITSVPVLEDMVYSYLYVPIDPNVAISLDPQYERFKRPSYDPLLTTNQFWSEVETLIVPLGLRWSQPNGMSASLIGSLVSQRVTAIPRAPSPSDSDQFFVIDLGLSYRFPKRRGLIDLSLKNLTNELFSYQDANIQSPQETLTPRFIPGRSLLLSLALTFD